jgi:molybdopterin-dependent oxidoreductase alpha subunit
MGVFERPSSALLDAMEREFGAPMPREDGLDSVAAITAMATGAASVFVGLGGNLARAAPDTTLVEAAFSLLAVNVGIATTLNRTHLLSDGLIVLLPTFGRSDVDMGPYGPRTVSVEDSMGLVHASTGVLRPPSDHVRSEITILAGLGTRLFTHEHPVAWSQFGIDYDVIRDHISRVVPGFTDFSARLRDRGGFELPHAPRDRREFGTASGRAQFGVTHVHQVPTNSLLLQTMRSHDQFNTSIYTSNDRYRGISGERDVLFISATDLRRLGLDDGQRVDVVTDLPGPERRLRGQRLVEFPTPPGSAAAYFPEANVLVPLSHHGCVVSTPGYKSVPVRLEVVHAGASVVVADSRRDGLSHA